MSKITETPRAKARAKFEGLLKEGMELKRLTYEELAHRIGVSRPTLNRMRNDPTGLTFAQVGLISDITGIPESAFHEVLRNVPRR
jgi:transcriptional regulator with XRE-family HTH domain